MAMTDRPACPPDGCVTRAQLEERLRQEREQAFPAGDARGHRDAHEELIEDEADRRALWKTVREKAVSSGVWAALSLLAVALWEYLRSGVHK